MTWRGAKKPRVLLLGEAWGESEAEAGVPFVGASGRELWRLLGQAWGEDARHAAAVRAFFRSRAWWAEPEAEEWLAEAGIGMTNVLNLRPQDNRLGNICGPTPARFRGVPLAPLGRSGPNFPFGAHLRQDIAERELERLQGELDETRPNLVVALGNTALWALSGQQNISSVRGATAQARLLRPGQKFLATYHPAGVLRQWSWRPIVLADLIKAKREGETPEIVRPRRRVLVSPTIDEVREWVQRVLADRPEVLSADCETRAGQITMVSFATTPGEALVVPFVVPETMARYWPRELEVQAWGLVRDLLESPIPKLGQNFIYDLQYFLRVGIKPRECVHDLMLLHHGLFPELQKGLGFLGSIYTDEASWKLLRRQRPDTEKRDE